MRYLRILLAMVFSTLKLWIKRICGCNVRFSMINLISPFSHIYTERSGKVFIGKKTVIRPNTEVKSNGGEIAIGDNCFFNRNCMVVAHLSVVIENNVTVGPGTYIYDHDHDDSGGFTTKPVTIKKNAWIGAGCIILKGVTIGENSTVAAGSVVTKDVPANTVFLQKRNERIIT